MEKIYMEESQKQSNKQKKNIVDATVVLSFVAAIFAIMSLIAFGFNQVSYSADPSDSGDATLSATSDPTSFVFNESEDYLADPDSGVPINILFDEHDNRLFCIQHNKDIYDEIEYNYVRKNKDGGLLYLLANGESYLRSKGVTNKDAIYWIMQMTIWFYMDDHYTDEVHDFQSGERDAISRASKIQKCTYVNDNPVCSDISLGTSTAAPGALVQNLLNSVPSNPNLSPDAVTLGVSKENAVENETTGGDYCSKITVANPGNSIESYDVSLSFEPSSIDGVYLWDGVSQRLSNSISAKSNGDTIFYVCIPKDNAPKVETTVNVSISSELDYYDGNVYSAVDDNGAQLQEVITGRKIPKPANGETSFNIVKSENTAMGQVKTIYFIGLIVLLCGIGIIYANAKPVEIKQ